MLAPNWLPSSILAVIGTADPYTPPLENRAPIHEDIDVLIIGGGFGGLLASARLQEHGIRNIRIIEKAGDFGQLCRQVIRDPICERLLVGLFGYVEEGQNGD